MRFYYINIFSVILLVLIWLIGTGLLVWLGSYLRKTRKRVWPVLVPLFLLLYIGPIAEELWIAWNFGQLCKKDAGIFIYKTVEVEGFYDSTRPTHAGPPTAQAVASFELGGYQFYEMLFPNRKGGSHQVVHLEKTNGVWTPTVLDQPTARYHYKELASHLPVSHQVKKFERVVVDQENKKVLGRYLNYYRGAPWFFIGLDRPTIPCAEARDRWAEGRSMLVWQSVLLPKE
jgi:hypothetical protein